MIRWQDLVCPNCAGPARLTNSREIYGKDYGAAYVCKRFPACDCYVGCHKGTTKPLGTLAGAELRRLRNQAHGAFDPLWTRSKDRRGARTLAYRWLAAQLGVAEIHIGESDAEACARIIAAVKKRLNTPASDQAIPAAAGRAQGGSDGQKEEGRAG